MEETTETILYVDDDADDREILSDALRELNPSVCVLPTAIYYKP